MKGKAGNSAILLILLFLLLAANPPFSVPAFVSGEPALQEPDNPDAAEPVELPGELEEPTAAPPPPDASAHETDEIPDADVEESESPAGMPEPGDQSSREEDGGEPEEWPDQGESTGEPEERPEDTVSGGDDQPGEPPPSSQESEQPDPEEETPPPGQLALEDLGNWTSYNGVIFDEATIYQSGSGGGLAIGGDVAVHGNFRVGATYSSEYDPTLHIGQYQNEEGNPALLLAGDTLTVDAAVNSLDVYGGAVAMHPALLEQNRLLPTGFTPRTDSSFRSGDQAALREWFADQYEMAKASSQLMLLGNDVRIDITQLSSGEYLEAGTDTYRNRFFQVGGEVHENALFITVQSDSDLNLGQWWPVHSVICLDVDWVLDSDLVVLNFPDAVNVTMNSSAFQIKGMQHWSTTVDAWVGDRGMEERLALAEKVVYNFPNARSIETDQALIQGTILAPDAAFTGIGFGDAGHIYGHIVANKYSARGNFTIHAFTLTRWVYDIVEDAIRDQKDTGSISLRHYLYFRGEPTTIRAGGGEFVLQDTGGLYFDGAGGFVADAADAAVYTTEQDRYTQIRNVPLGAYTLVKTNAPEGFELNDADPGNAFTYAQFPVVVARADQTVQAVRYSEPVFTDLYFRKVDADTGEGLAGAVFTIVREEDEFQDAAVGETYESGEDGVFVSRHVPVGDYHLVEVEPPPDHGLVAGGEVRFRVSWDEEAGALAVRGPQGEPLTATAQNPLEIPNEQGVAGNTVMLIKYTQEPEEPGTFYTLPGAAFALYGYDEAADRWTLVERDTAGEEIDIVTNTYGYCRIDKLPDGAYRLVETRPPPGYQTGNRYGDEAQEGTFPNGYAYAFTFAQTGSFYTAYIEDKALETDLTVTVSGLLLGERRPLRGTGLRLEHLLGDGKTWEEWVESADTGEDGALVLEGLTAGTYRLTQLGATRGFSALDPSEVRFAVAFDERGDPSIQAVWAGQAVGPDTGPVRLTGEDGLRLEIANEANLCGYLVYKIDGDYTAGTDESGMPTYTVDYLEGAQFRLRRRLSVRSLWSDYGGPFESELRYDGDGAPVLDSYGNHIAFAEFADGLLFGEYQLVETRPPDGFHPGSDIQVLLDDGAVGYQVHLFTITDDMAAAGRTSTYTATDYGERHSVAFRFRLADAGNGAQVLPGAEFSLYQCEEAHEHDSFLGGGSCWGRSTPVVAASDSAGVVSFGDLVSGEYLLRQDRSPSGYRLPGALWRVTVDARAGEIAILQIQGAASDNFTRIHSGDVRWLLRNRKSFSLPTTGGGGVAAYTAAGLLLIAAAFGILTIIKRKG